MMRPSVASFDPSTMGAHARTPFQGRNRRRYQSTPRC